MEILAVGKGEEMAKNDIEIIIYKILRYLYGKMQSGERPEFTDMCWNSKLMDIPERYWKQVIVELVDKMYVKGIRYRYTKDGILIDMFDNVGITLEGREFLVNNSGMAKAKEYLGAAFEILLSQII